MRALRVSCVKLLAACVAPAAALLIAGCDTTTGTGMPSILDTSLSFVRDLALNVLAAVLL